MAQLMIEEPLASRIREIAQRDNVTPQEMVGLLLERYSPAPRPPSSLTDDDIEIPDDIIDKEAYRRAARALAPKLYDKAREYWRKVGDSERLALTDEELDKQFWLFDGDGVPRLKSEQGQITLPHDPLEDLIGVLDTDQTDLSLTVRETIREYFEERDGRSD